MATIPMRALKTILIVLEDAPQSEVRCCSMMRSPKNISQHTPTRWAGWWLKLWRKVISSSLRPSIGLPISSGFDDMKAVILAGGLGTRISEESHLKPKPMIEIGGHPILWHIMKIYSHYGINEFIVCLGYKGYVIKEYFANYFLHMSDVTFDMQKNQMEVHHRYVEPWRVTLVDTGEDTQTGGRLKRVRSHIG